MIITPYNRTHKVSRRVRHCVSELESLAIAPNRLNELNDAYEMEDLVNNIKLTFYQDFKSDRNLKADTNTLN
jgi:hypothetical protein